MNMPFSSQTSSSGVVVTPNPSGSNGLGAAKQLKATLEADAERTGLQLDVSVRSFAHSFLASLHWWSAMASKGMNQGETFTLMVLAKGIEVELATTNLIGDTGLGQKK